MSGAPRGAELLMPFDMNTALAQFLQNLIQGTVGGSASGVTVRFADGTVSAPSMGFVSQPTTGVYFPAASSIGLALVGTQYLLLDANGLTVPRSDEAFRLTADTSIKRAAAGHSLVSTGLSLETRTNAAVTTDGNVTHTAANILGGIITRSAITANRVDAFPTAASLVAALPGAVVGTSGEFWLNNNDDASTITFNGASTGVTYEGAATALAAGDTWLFKWHITSITASSEAVTVYQIAK